MEFRNLGKSGLKVPALSLGTATFGGTNEFFKRWGEVDIKQATRLIDISLERGVNFFDTANVYSTGDSENILGEAIKGRRNRLLISTKAGFAMGEGANEKGLSRFHIMREVEDSLRRLKTDYIDVYFVHAFDNETPVEETLTTLHHLIAGGKLRYIGCSNFAAWQLMKSLSISERLNLEKYVIYQGYYSLIGRDYEQELMPLLKDQGLSLMVWSPLGWGRLKSRGKTGENSSASRIKNGGLAGSPPVPDEHLNAVLDVLDEISLETGKTVSQIAINWVLQNNTVSNVVIGARNEEQLIENLNATDWNLTQEYVDRLNAVSQQQPIYPHWVGER